MYLVSLASSTNIEMQNQSPLSQLTKSRLFMEQLQMIRIQKHTLLKLRRMLHSYVVIGSFAKGLCVPCVVPTSAVALSLLSSMCTVFNQENVTKSTCNT